MNVAQLRAMREEFEKQASWAKDDLPWYTTAAGATGGTLAASKFVPKKYRAAGQVGGALLGTAAGLEGGKVIGRRFDKTAADGGAIVDSLPESGAQAPEDEGPLPPPPPIDMAQVRKKLPPHPAVTAGKTLAGLGIGMGAGYAGMKGLDYALEKARGPGKGLPSSKLMWAIPAATAALGMAYPYMHQATVDKMRKDHLDRQEAKRGG